MRKNHSPLINGDFYGKDILSLNQFSLLDIGILFSLVNRLCDKHIFAEYADKLQGSIAALLFYEPSSRTFSSFDAAVKRLSGQTIDIRNPEVVSSVAKGETLEDTIRVFETYADTIVIRHKDVGTAQKAAAVATIPVINAGDGIGEHPTQALLDIYTIYKHTGRLDNLTGLIAGDLLNGRTVHSLLRALALGKDNTVYLLSPKELRLPSNELSEIKKRGVKLIEIDKSKDIPMKCDFWYWTRVQKERFSDMRKYEKVKNLFIVDKKFLNKFAGKETILMHPLPRVGEILPQVDLDPRAMYFKQMENGLYIRMALLLLVLGKAL